MGITRARCTSLPVIQKQVNRPPQPTSGDDRELVFERHHLLGLLLAVDTQGYEDRVAELIAVGSDAALDAVLNGFASDALNKRLPPPLVDALFERMDRSETRVQANPPLFEYLAVHAPERFINHLWSEKWDSWMPESREALVYALARAAVNVEGATTAIIGMYRSLMGDRNYAVRRGAARSWAAIEMHSFREWCSMALDSGLPSAQVRAAEAATWLGSDSPTAVNNAVLIKASRSQERVARDAAARSLRELRRRVSSLQLRSAILESRSDANAWVLSNYAAGLALARVGDDSDMEILARAENDATIPPNVRYWFRRTRKKLEKQWKETTRKWPQPSTSWRGAIERTTATIVVGGKRYPIDAAIWVRRRRTSQDRSSWGGAGTLEGFSGELVSAQDEEALLEIDGRAAGRILIVAISNFKDVVFSGNGEYPERKLASPHGTVSPPS